MTKKDTAIESEISEVKASNVNQKTRTEKALKKSKELQTSVEAVDSKLSDINDKETAFTQNLTQFKSDL